MTKFRVLIFLTTVLVVGLVGTYASLYARGYRLNFKTLTFQPNGILVIKSEPDGASVIIDGELAGATNTTLSLTPRAYDIEIKKEGYFSWRKRLVIEKEIVTSASVSLFKSAPSLSPITLNGAQNPAVSDDGTKIVFSIPKGGLYTVNTFNLPLGFSNEPKKIAEGDMTNASYIFSPDARQILLTTINSIFLINAESLTPQTQWVNVSSKKESILKEWKTEKSAKDKSLLNNLPPEVSDILLRKASDFIFSPDGQMILYTASNAASLQENLVLPLPGASTQKQERIIQPDHTYIYDIKEDRNFLISEEKTTLRWMPSGHNILEAGENQITIMDYDGTNRQVVYSGSYLAPFAFPFSNSTKLLILTNLGATSATPNLYTLTVK